MAVVDNSPEEEFEDENILGIPIKRLILWLSLTVGALVVIMIIWMMTHNRYVVTVDISEVDAPRQCWQDIDGGLLTKSRDKARSRAPRRSYLGYCGVVRTTFGNFVLPESYPRPWMGQSREEIHQRLLRGCRYDLVVLSERGRPSTRDRGRSNRYPPVIRRIQFTYPC